MPIIINDTNEFNIIPGVDPGTSQHPYLPASLLSVLDSFLKGTMDFNILSVPSFTYSGELLNTFLNDWYYRIHMVPRELNLGNVVNSQERQLMVWNAYFENKNLTSVNHPALIGMQINEPVTPPYAIKPLEVIYYTLAVDVNGPPTIDTNYSWLIDGRQYSIRVTGKRVTVWSIEPSWDSPVTEVLEWKTDILKPFTGKEQRSGLRTRPRRFLEYNITSTDVKVSSIFRNLLWGWQNRNYAVPIWFDESKLTSAVSAGSTAINLDTLGLSFFNGGLLLIYKNEMEYESIEIVFITSGSISLKQPLEKSWPVGTRVFPINICRIPDSVNSQNLTDSFMRSQIRFAADPLQTDPSLSTAPATSTFNGKELFTKSPNWDKGISSENQYPYAIYDSNTSGVYPQVNNKVPILTMKRQFFFKNTTQLIEFKGFLNRVLGRKTAFYVPSWFTDFVLYEPVVASATTIRVVDNEFYRMVGLSEAIKGLMIYLPGKTPVYRKISNISYDNDGFISLALDGNLTYDLTPEMKPLLSLIHLCRLSSDQVSFQYLTLKKALVDISFTTVIQ